MINIRKWILNFIFIILYKVQNSDINFILQRISLSLYLYHD